MQSVNARRVAVVWILALLSCASAGRSTAQDAPPRAVFSSRSDAFFLRNSGATRDRTSRILSRIATDIRSGYTIGYSPSREVGADAGGFRAVKVEVSTPERRNLTVRARSGYVVGPAGAHGDR